MSESNKAQNQTDVKSIFIQNPWKIFLWEIFLFGLILGLGITAAFFLQGFLKTEKISLPKISFWDFILYFALVTLFILFISFFPGAKKGKGIIYKLLFIFISWWAGGILISIWLPDLLALLLMGGLVFWRWEAPNILNHNLCIVLALAGAGSTLGIALQPQTVVLLLVIFSIYDFIAVYKTKHMQKMAKEMGEYGAILALIVPQKISDFRQSLKEVKPGGKFLILGGGDVAFPLLLCVSLLSSGIFNSIIVAIFSTIGLSVSFWIFINQKLRKPMPALPPIALFSIIGYFITVII